MASIPHTHPFSRYRLLLGGLLVSASIISVILERAHTLVAGAGNYRFLPWNLFLAWIPFIAAVVASLSIHKRSTFYLVMPVCALVWLAFFPNAPYLLTDFQHLAYKSSAETLWFDVIMMIWFAWTGLMLGVTSLYLMQEIVTRMFNPVVGWIFAVGATCLSSVGVYLGRFMRWNSWNLLQDPLPIAKDMYEVIRHPRSNFDTYVFLALFTLLFLFIYVAIHLFARIARGDARKSPDDPRNGA